MAKMGEFTAQIAWTGNRGDGTRTYRGYDRTWDLKTAGGMIVECSNDPMLGGDASKPNPEELLIASLAACHMLWYLHLASEAGLVIRGYRDDPVGIGETRPNGEGQFIKAVLRPTITIERGFDREKAEALHHDVSGFCFIARSINFPVSYEANYVECDRAERG